VKRTMIYRARKGFTLVELIVTMAVFMIILVIAAQVFNTIVTNASKYSKMEESNIEGIIGLEILRHDMEQMGFGLFWGFQSGSTVSYLESLPSASPTNDSPSSAPRAFVALNNAESFSSDLLAIKATSVGSNKASQRWTYISFNNYSAATYESRPVIWRSNNLNNADKAIAIRTNFNDPNDDHLLLSNGSSFDFSFANSGINAAFLPTKDTEVSMVYGIETNSTTPRMPFNRTDFFVTTAIPLPNRPAVSVPPFCAELTGVLIKATVNHNGGGYTPIPLLDCVADMQVVLGWDGSEGGKAGSVSGYSSVNGDAAAGVTTSEVQGWLADPKGIREHLKIVKVYILAQEGKKDTGFTYPLASIVVGDTTNGETSMTSTYNFSATQRNYRWKLYRVIVRPKNLVSNQQ
jgi:prepilin-type N-terminal cleavage/methylation domain-containing protein